MLENAALLKRLSELGVTSVVNKADDLSHIGLAVQHVSRNLEYMSPSVKASLDTLRMNASATTTLTGSGIALPSPDNTLSETSAMHHSKNSRS